jgi:hypothetical protein
MPNNFSKQSTEHDTKFSMFDFALSIIQTFIVQLTVFNKFTQLKIIKNKKIVLTFFVTDIIREVLVSDTYTEVFDSKFSSV